jgi:hypothetical protein
MTEVEIFNLQSGSVQSTGLYFVGIAFSVWVAMRVSSVVSQRAPDNMVMKLLAGAYGICVVYYLNLTNAFFAYNMELAGHRLLTLKQSGGSISASSETFIANVGASATPPSVSLVPSDPVGAIMSIAILGIVLLPLINPQPDNS